MKKSILLSLIIFIATLLSGCSQSNYVLIQNNDGTVEQIFSIDLNIDELNNAGITDETQIETLKNKLYTEIQTSYTKTMSKYRLSVRTNPQLTEQQKVFYEGGITTQFGWDNNILAIAIKFNSTDIYNYFREFQNVKDTATLTTSDSLFTTKTTKEILTIYGQIYKDDLTTIQYFKEKYKEYITTNFSEEIYNKLPALKFTYSYITPTSRIHSDSDQFLITNLGYMHIWNFDENEESFKISIYTLTARPIAWYLLALTITFIFIAIFLVVVYFKKDKRFKINKK